MNRKINLAIPVLLATSSPAFAKFEIHSIACDGYYYIALNDSPCSSESLCEAVFKCSTKPETSKAGAGWESEPESIGSVPEQYFSQGCESKQYWNVYVRYIPNKIDTSPNETETAIRSCKVP